MTYKLTSDPSLIRRVEDGVSIPRGHRWWAEYEEWIADGNTPLPAEPPPPEPPDADAELAAAIQAATTLSELKAALLGQSGKLGKVAGKPT